MSQTWWIGTDTSLFPESISRFEQRWRVCLAGDRFRTSSKRFTTAILPYGETGPASGGDWSLSTKEGSAGGRGMQLFSGRGSVIDLGMAEGVGAYFEDHKESRNLGRLALRGGIASVVMQYGNGVLQIAAAVVLARLLAPEDFGLVAIVTVLTSFAPLLIDFGLGDATTQRSRITQSQVSSLFWLSSGIGLTVAIVVAACSPLIAWIYREPRLEHIALYSAITFVLFGASNQHLALLRRTMQFARIAQIQILGGSLRVYLCRADAAHATLPAVAVLLAHEREIGFEDIRSYERFSARVHHTKRQLLSFLIQCKEAGAKLCGYGAPGKGNTLLNYCGIGTDFLDFSVDRNPYKHGRYTPGMHIPIYPVSAIDEARPDYLLILPWKLKSEIVAQMRHIGAWGCKMVVPIPNVEVIDPRESSS